MDFADERTNDPILIEIGVQDADLASSMHCKGSCKYLGVSGDARHIEALQSKHPKLADRLTHSRRRRLVLENNAEVLILSGASTLSIWKYRSVRHARHVGVRLGWSLYTLPALLGYLWHVLSRHYSFPRMVKFQPAGGKTRHLVASRVLRQKTRHRQSLHFVPHSLGLTGLFRTFEQQQIRYVVMRWFATLPESQGDEDLDLLVADRSLSAALATLGSLPGIVPCDVYSENGLARSDYRGAPYYPPHVAARILDRAVQHNSTCAVPDPWSYFHSLAYHAVYHKGTRSNLCRGNTGLPAGEASVHDYAGTLQEMADRMQIDVDISLEGLHAYLRESGWGPSPEALARLFSADQGNAWLGTLSERAEPYIHDQGLAVFVLRERAVRLGFRDRILDMLRQSGFEIITTSALTPEQVEIATPRVRGGNWGAGPFDVSGGPPAVVVVAYDHNPLQPNRRQRRKFPERTNARIFVKEEIRDAIIAELPVGQRCNALHSSDHAAEAWHLIEVLSPDLLDKVRVRLQQIRESDTLAPTRRRAA